MHSGLVLAFSILEDDFPPCCPVPSIQKFNAWYLVKAWNALETSLSALPILCPILGENQKDLGGFLSVLLLCSNSWLPQLIVGEKPVCFREISLSFATLHRATYVPCPCTQRRLMTISLGKCTPISGHSGILIHHITNTAVKHFFSASFYLTNCRFIVFPLCCI